MVEFKGTAAPWEVYHGPMKMGEGLNPFYRGIVALLRSAGDEDGDWAVIVPDNRDAHNYEANARLIAAAPDLREALTETEHAFHVMAEHRGPVDDCEMTRCVKNRALIQKALGSNQEEGR